MNTEKSKQYLITNYKRSMLQLEVEAKTMAAYKPNSKLYRAAKKTVEDIGHALAQIQYRWIECGHKEPIVPELID